MLNTLSSYYYRESLASDVAEFCQNCVVCAKDRQINSPLLYQLVLPNCAFHTISINIMGPIKRSKNSDTNRYIIAAIDHFTKWVKVEVISSPSAKVTAKFILSNIVLRHGFPKQSWQIMVQTLPVNLLVTLIHYSVSIITLVPPIIQRQMALLNM